MIHESMTQVPNENMKCFYPGRFLAFPSMLRSGPVVCVVMGVSGCGKTSMGKRLADILHGEFIEGDDWHPASNRQKMRNGIPLTDEDRLPWLSMIRTHTLDIISQGCECVVIACSCLKRNYRNFLLSELGVSTCTIYLQIAMEDATHRVEARADHFFPGSLVRSQFEILEEPGVEEPDVLVLEQSVLTDVDYLARLGADWIASRWNVS